MNNLVKSDKFVVGGWARSKSWGTRVYRVLNVFEAGRTINGKWVMEQYVTLQKTFETNKGTPSFTNSKPFTVRGGDVDGMGASVGRCGCTLHWYYPAKAVVKKFY